MRDILLYTLDTAVNVAMISTIRIDVRLKTAGQITTLFHAHLHKKVLILLNTQTTKPDELFSFTIKL